VRTPSRALFAAAILFLIAALLAIIAATGWGFHGFK
jgi:hypothetical protein